MLLCFLTDLSYRFELDLLSFPYSNIDFSCPYSPPLYYFVKYISVCYRSTIHLFTYCLLQYHFKYVKR